MEEFSATLLREKFVIQDSMPADLSDKEPVVALSNRLVLPLVNPDTKETETFVVRAQNMHSCVRMAAQIALAFQKDGAILNRTPTFSWDEAYRAVMMGYEGKFNPRNWIAVYHKGRPIYESGEEEAQRHILLDIIEQCDARNKQDYERSLDIAEDAFKQAGRLVTIKHDSNIALILNITKKEGRCGVILRSPSRTTTFNFIIHAKAERAVTISECMTVSAAFLEAIQLTFFIGMSKQKIHYEFISPSSPEGLQYKDAQQKLGRLRAAIDQFETMMNVKYRPESPDFTRLISDAEEFAKSSLTQEIEQKIKNGEDSDWIM